MKKTLVAAILGLAATASVMAQGRIVLDTYASAVLPYPTVSYGPGANGPVNTLVPGAAGYTVGFFYSTTVAAFSDPSGVGTPGGTFVLATGTGSTTSLGTIPASAGLFTSSTDFAIAGNTGVPVYLVVVAYSGANYAGSTYRGHSSVFQVTANNSFGGGTALGGAMSAFQVLPVPEPSTFALAGLGLAGLLIFRRRK